MERRNIVVIGASAGGIGAIKELFSTIPEDFEAYIFIVVHIAPHVHSLLPQILNKCNRLKAKHPTDGEVMELNTIYIALPDHHILIEKDKVLVKKGPKENRFRPSIDALFRSAAYNCSSRVIGIIMSGLMDDGTAGLWSVKQQHGISIIQNPEDAEFPNMPLNVLEYVEVDYSIPVREMATLLNKLTKEPVPTTLEIKEINHERLKMEVKIAAEASPLEMGLFGKGAFTPLTCPECSGALVQFTEGKIIRYRCHTGHGYTDKSLLESVTKSVEENLWKTIRGLEEALIILQQSARRFEESGNEETAGVFYQKARKMHESIQLLRKYIFEQDRVNTDIAKERIPGI